MTGPNAAFGAQLKNGAEQAAADINAAGGINGQKIELVFGDDVSDPKQGVSVANKFVGEGVKFVVGHFNSGVSIPASDVYAENGILQITPASTNPKITERGLWNTFRTCGRDDQQGGVAGELHRLDTQGQEDRHRPRQDDLRQGPRRRDQEGDEREAASPRCCMKASTPARRISPRSSPRSRQRAPSISTGVACTPKAV